MKKPWRKVMPPWAVLPAVALLLLLVLRPPEPVYQGEPLSYWVKQLQPDVDHHGQAEAAIRAIGPGKAIPCLLHTVRHEYGFYERLYDESSSRLPPVLHHWLPEPSRSAEFCFHTR